MTKTNMHIASQNHNRKTSQCVILKDKKKQTKIKQIENAKRQKRNNKAASSPNKDALGNSLPQVE